MMNELAIKCKTKIDEELTKYQADFKSNGLDILGDDGDMYAAMREAHAVVESIISDATDNQLNAILSSANILTETAAAYVKNPMVGLSGEKDVAIKVIEGSVNS